MKTYSHTWTSEWTTDFRTSTLDLDKSPVERSEWQSGCVWDFRKVGVTWAKISDLCWHWHVRKV